MNLVQQAERDLSFTLEDIDNGFGVELILIDDEQNRYYLACQTTDIGFFTDPQTGVAVAGRQVEISFRISSLVAQGGTYPRKSWTVNYIDTNANEWKMKIQEDRPDRKIGIYNLLLEVKKT